MNNEIRHQLSLAKDELTRLNNLRRILKYTMGREHYRVITHAHRGLPMDVMGMNVDDFVKKYDTNRLKVCRGFSRAGVILEDTDYHRMTDYDIHQIDMIVKIEDWYESWNVCQVLYRSDNGKTTFVIPEIVEERRMDKIKDISIKIVDKLVELGIVRDCTDTDDEQEFDVQDSIREILSECL